MAGEQILILTLLGLLCVSARVSRVTHNRYQDNKDELACNMYKCKEKHQIFNEDICIYWENSTDTYFVDPCHSSKKECSSGSASTNVTCTPISSISQFAYPGEYCLKDTDCVSGKCKDEHCDGKDEDEACDFTTDCNPGLFCPHKTGNCTQLMPQDVTGCIDDSQCDYNSVCSPIIGNEDHLNKCIAYFSLDVNDKISSCRYKYIEPQCGTGVCMSVEEDSDETEEETYKGFCAEVEASYNDPATTKCTYDSKMCLSTSGKLRTECECGHNPSGDAYCNLHPGDTIYTKYFKYYKRWVESGKSRKCNSARRDTLECMQAHWNSDDYIDYHYYKYLTENWPQLQNNKDCVNQIYFNEYKTAKEEYEESHPDGDDDEDDDNDSAYRLAMAAAAVFLAIL